MTLLLKEYKAFEYDPEKTVIENDSMIVTGILQRADAENQNGRVYPYEILVKEIENYKKLIKEKRAFGEVDHDDSPIVNVKNASHRIIDIWMEDKTVYGKVLVMPHPTSGGIIQTIIKTGGVPGISSRALGSVEKRNGVNVVQDDLQIICWDFVSEPSTHGAFMKLSEAKEVDPKLVRKVFTKSDRVNRILNEITGIL
jgi:hypothetical protein